MIILRSQELVKQNMFNIWIVLRDKGVEQGLAHGVVDRLSLEKLEVELTDAVIERKAAFDGEFSDEPRPETKAAAQASLFKEPS